MSKEQEARELIEKIYNDSKEIAAQKKLIALGEVAIEPLIEKLLEEDGKDAQERKAWRVLSDHDWDNESKRKIIQRMADFLSHERAEIKVDAAFIMDHLAHFGVGAGTEYYTYLIPVMDRIIEGLDDEEDQVREKLAGCLRSLGVRGIDVSEAIDALCKLTIDENEHTKKRAYEALEHAVENKGEVTAATPVLLEGLIGHGINSNGDSVNESVTNAVKMLIERGVEIDPEKIVDVRSKVVCLMLLDRIQEVVEMGGAAVPGLILFADHDLDRTLDVLAQIDKETVINGLIDATKEETGRWEHCARVIIFNDEKYESDAKARVFGFLVWSRGNRKTSAEKLEQLGETTEEVESCLIEAIQCDNLAMEAIELVSELKSKRAIPALIEKITDEKIQEKVAEALGKIEPDAEQIGEIVKKIIGKNPLSDRINIIKILGKIATVECIPHLLDNIDDGRKGLIYSALEEVFQNIGKRKPDNERVVAILEVYVEKQPTKGKRETAIKRASRVYRLISEGRRSASEEIDKGKVSQGTVKPPTGRQGLVRVRKVSAR